jgi:hypothetical protein
MYICVSCCNACFTSCLYLCPSVYIFERVCIYVSPAVTPVLLAAYTCVRLSIFSSVYVYMCVCKVWSCIEGSPGATQSRKQRSANPTDHSAPKHTHRVAQMKGLKLWFNRPGFSGSKNGI